MTAPIQPEGSPTAPEPQAPIAPDPETEQAIAPPTPQPPTPDAPPIPPPQPIALWEQEKAAGAAAVHGIESLAHDVHEARFGNTVEAGLTNTANDLSNATVATARTGLKVMGGVDPFGDKPSSAINPFQFDTEARFGQPRNWIESFGRTALPFALLSSLTGGAGEATEIPAEFGKAARATIETGRFLIRNVKPAAIMTVGSDPHVQNAVLAHWKTAPNAPIRNMIGNALGASPADPDWLAYTRSFGTNFLSNLAIDGTIASAMGIAAHANGWGEDQLQGWISGMKNSEADVARPLALPDGSVKVSPTEDIVNRGRQRSLTPGGGIDFSGHADDMERLPSVAQQDRQAQEAAADRAFERPAMADTAALGPLETHFHPDALHTDVTLPDAGQAEVEIAQRNVAEKNLSLAEKGPSAYADGWKEVATALRAGHPLKVLNRIFQDHDITVPTGTTGPAFQDYIAKLAKIVKAVPVEAGPVGSRVRPDIRELAEKAASAMAPDVLPSVTLARIGRTSTTDPLHTAVALHLYARAAAAQGERVAQAFAEAPESPAAAQAMERTYHTLSTIHDVMHHPERLAQPATEEAPLADLPATAEAPAAATAVPPAAATPPVEAGAPAVETAPEPTSGTTEPTEGTPTTPTLSPKARDQFAMDLRMAEGHPAEAMQAVRTARLQGGAGEPPPEEPAAPAGGAEGGAQKPQMTAAQKATRSLGYYVINNQISGLPTLAKVMTSQAFMTVKMPIETFGAGVVRGTKGWFKDDALETAAGQALRSEAGHQAAGLITESGEALNAAWRAFKAGRSLIDPMATMFPGGQLPQDFWSLGNAKWLVGQAVGMPGRVHTSLTEFTKTLVYRSHVRATTMRLAEQAGASPEEIGQAVQEQLSRAFAPNGTAIDHLDDAMDQAQRATLTRPLDGVLMGKKFNSMMEDHPLVRVIATPFQKVSTNAFAETWSMMPGLAMYKKSVQEQMANGGDDAARAISNQAFGAAAVGTGLYLAARGHFVGIGPTTTQLRDQREAQGIRPYSVNIGNSNWSLTRMPLIGVMMGAPAEASDILADFKAREDQRVERWKEVGGNKNVYFDNHPVCQFLRQVCDYYDATRGSDSNEGMKAMEALTLSASKLALNETALSGLAKVLSIATSGDGEQQEADMDRWFQDEAKTLVPWGAFWKSVNTDPIHRETRGVIQNLKAQVPGFSQTLEPMYNATGHEIEQAPGFLDWQKDGTTNPAIGTLPQAPAGVQSEFLAFGRNLPGIPKTTPGPNGVASVDWTNREKYDRQGGASGVSPWARAHQILATPFYFGQTAEEAITDLMTSDFYKSLPQRSGPLDTDGPRFQQVSKLVDRMNKMAIQQMMAEPRYAAFAAEMNANKGFAKNEKRMSDSAAYSARSAVLGDSARVVGQPNPVNWFPQ